jgi:hypothetical protein
LLQVFAARETGSAAIERRLRRIDCERAMRSVARRNPIRALRVKAMAVQGELLSGPADILRSVFVLG